MAFDISNTTLHELISIPSRNYFHFEDEERSVLTLNVERTAREKGRRFCFTKETYQSGNQWTIPPRVEYPCYPRGEGVPSEARLLHPK